MNTIIEINQLKPKFWDSWKGRIIRAIALDDCFGRDEILKRTRLKENQFELAFNELLQEKILEEKRKDYFWVSLEFCKAYRSYSLELQKDLVNWVNQWRRKENVPHKRNHFYLEDRLLYEFSEKTIEKANLEILAANPWVKRCHISEALKSMSQKGVNLKIITRSENKNYLRELIEDGVSLVFDDSVHAKLLVVDRCVGIVSSMNYYAGSSGGAVWEAGLVTIERSIVKSIADSISKKP